MYDVYSIPKFKTNQHFPIDTNYWHTSISTCNETTITIQIAWPGKAQFKKLKKHCRSNIRILQWGVGETGRNPPS